MKHQGYNQPAKSEDRKYVRCHPLRAVHRPGADYLVPFGYDLINGDGEIGECGEACGIVPLGFLYALDVLIWFVSN